MKDDISTHPYYAEIKYILERIQHYGGELPKDKDALLEQILSMDEIRFSVTIAGKERGIYIVLGNEPGIALANYICDDVLDKVSDDVYNKFNEVETPMETYTLKTSERSCLHESERYFYENRPFSGITIEFREEGFGYDKETYGIVYKDGEEIYKTTFWTPATGMEFSECARVNVDNVKELLVEISKPKPLTYEQLEEKILTLESTVRQQDKTINEVIEHCAQTNKLLERAMESLEKSNKQTTEAIGLANDLAKLLKANND